jgi:hypothetical protein
MASQNTRRPKGPIYEQQAFDGQQTLEEFLVFEENRGE